MIFLQKPPTGSNYLHESHVTRQFTVRSMGLEVSDSRKHMQNTNKQKQHEMAESLFSGVQTAASTEAAAIPCMNVVVTDNQLGKRLPMHDTCMISSQSFCAAP